MSKASFRQAGAVLRLMDEAEWDSAHVQTFEENWGCIRDLTVALHEGRLTQDELKAVVEGRFEILTAEEATVEPASVPLPTTHPVTVDYTQTLEQMIAAGRYDTRNNDITQEHFPLQGTGQVEVGLHLVHLNRDASTDAVLAELDRRNLRPATIEELLALGAKYPNLQREFSVIALGSAWRGWGGGRGVAYLGYWSGGRGLSLRWLGGDWSRLCRFLAVSK